MAQAQEKDLEQKLEKLSQEFSEFRKEVSSFIAKLTIEGRSKEPVLKINSATFSNSQLPDPR